MEKLQSIVELFLIYHRLSNECYRGTEVCVYNRDGSSLPIGWFILSG